MNTCESQAAGAVRVFAGDGCLMEGVSSEASSLAGHWKLANLALIYDDNGITIDAPTSATFSESVRDRYRSYGWNVITVDDGNDREARSAAYAKALASDDAPTFIDVRTKVAYGIPDFEGTTAAHGGALPTGLVERAKRSYRWTYPEPFTVPDAAYAAWRSRASNAVPSLSRNLIGHVLSDRARASLGRRRSTSSSCRPHPFPLVTCPTQYSQD